MSKRCKEFVLSFIWISSDEHDSRFQESSLKQRQIPESAIKGSFVRVSALLVQVNYISNADVEFVLLSRPRKSGKLVAFKLPLKEKIQIRTYHRGQGVLGARLGVCCGGGAHAEINASNRSVQEPNRSSVCCLPSAATCVATLSTALRAVTYGVADTEENKISNNLTHGLGIFSRPVV
ncbi:hypothetical protein J6590_038973 [Homalodisca vitripennis]|nr:hypothetical protein J6590_038973 [Homalodisca vitripennis]